MHHAIMGMMHPHDTESVPQLQFDQFTTYEEFKCLCLVCRLAYICVLAQVAGGLRNVVIQLRVTCRFSFDVSCMHDDTSEGTDEFISKPVLAEPRNTPRTTEAFWLRR